VRGLDGRTRCLQFPHNVVTGLELKAQVQRLEGIPPSLQRLMCGRREVNDQLTLVADNEHQLMSCQVLLRLRGGKGGFGSLLRGAAKNKNATDNTDSCRDLSGRRLRHVNAEKKLKEWQEEDKERDLEVVAQRFIKDQETRRKGVERNVELANDVAQASAVVVKKVATSVQNGLKEAHKLAEMRVKRSEEERSAAEAAGSSKRQCNWGLPNDSDMSGSDDDDEDDDEDKASPSSGKGKGSLSSAKGKGSPSSTDTPEPTTPPADQEVLVEEVATVVGFTAVNVDLRTAKCAKELEAMGLELLKEKLVKRGLKAGGSLQERAERYFMLKNTPLESIDKKHFANKK